jgi:prepilin-type N-terminal cleavage/methylation domain-containing protein
MRRGGYTLVELILVVVILAIIGGLVWSYRGNTVQTRVLHREATKVISMLRQARALAIARSTRTRLVIDTVANTAQLELLEDPLASLEDYTPVHGDWGNVVEFDEEVTLTLTNRDEGLEVEEIGFHSDGTSDPVDIDFIHEKVEESIRIRIEPLTGLAEYSTIEENE